MGPEIQGRVAAKVQAWFESPTGKGNRPPMNGSATRLLVGRAR
jgi:hypothetical protein